MTGSPLPLVQGTLDLLVLRTLQPRALHGYGIATAVRDRTGGDLNIEDAALYQALHRLDRQGLVEADWRLSENNRRARYYRLTPPAVSVCGKRLPTGVDTRSLSKPFCRGRRQGTAMRERLRQLSFWYLRRRPDVVASEIDEELNLHLELRVEELKSRGMTTDEARQEALRQFGDLEQTRRYCRRQDEEKDTRHATHADASGLHTGCSNRVSRPDSSPILALTILGTVGLGIGATTAIFSAVHAALFRPLPYADPDQLVRLYTDTPPFKFRFSIADYLALQAQQTHFEQVATYTGRTMTFSDGHYGRAPERLSGVVGIFLSARHQARHRTRLH